MYNPYVGIYKFILALLVVAIHVEPFTGDLAFYINNCFARIGVPSFFVLSSYFLFDKLLNRNWDKTTFWNNQKHLAKYYGIWLLLHAPVILFRLYEVADGPLNFIWLVIQAVCLKGPYGALWFLPATLMAVYLVYIIGKKYGPNLCLILSFPLFLFAALETEYYVLIKDILWMRYLNDFLNLIFGWLANGLTFGFFFCSVGFYIAYNKEKIRNTKIDVLAATISMILLFLETTIIRDCRLGVSYGAMLLLIPAVYFIVQVLLQTKPNSNQKIVSVSKYLQNMSLLIYPMHFAIMEFFEYILKDNSIYIGSTTLQYVVVTAVTCGLSAMILYLGKTKTFAFMKCLYGK